MARLFSLYGCGKLCAAVCCWVAPSNIGDIHVCKLDSVIVHGRLRKCGLGSLLVYKAFLDLVTESVLEGGYNPGATASACAAHVGTLMAA